MGPNRSCAVAANDGRKRACFIEAVSRETDYSGSAKTVNLSMSASTTSRSEKVVVCEELKDNDKEMLQV